VHYPTDINLLLDAMRKVIFLTADLCEANELTDFRQHQYNFRVIKRFMRKAQNVKRGKPKSDENKKKKEQDIQKAHQDYINEANIILRKATHTLLKIDGGDLLTEIRISEIKKFMTHAHRQIDQIERRVILGQQIPHDEKVFSIFQPHTEWISKGKAGVPVELGLRVCIVEDQYQFILHHQVMEKKTDDQVAVSITQEAKERFPKLHQLSYDKGFHSPENQEALKNELENVILPRKGKLSQQARALENTEDFLKARRQHSAVESAINALEVHGLDMCRDHGIRGFKRYVSLAIVAHNIDRIGVILKSQEQKQAARKRKKYMVRQPGYKIAA
jgi:transposase, IS5 family